MATTPRDELAEQVFHRAVVEAALDVQAITTVDGTYRFVSSACLTLFGWRPVDLVGGCQDEYTHPDDVALVRAERARALIEPTCSVFRFRCADDTYRWTEALSTILLGYDEPLLISSMRDVSDPMESDLELQRKATTDPLTGVANRTVFMDRLHQALRRLERRDGLVAVLFLDLDRFKLINDSVGHHVGDAVLSQMAQRIRGFLRPQDTLARLGGDDLRDRAIGRLGTERMLRRAIDESRMRVEYQPIIDLGTGRTVAAEALVRVWDPDSAELLAAEHFIDVAEESGLLRTIDD